MPQSVAAFSLTKPAALALLLLPVALVPPLAHAQSPTLKIRIINARTNRPITDEQLNVALKVDQIGSVQMATDKNGLILVNLGDATIIRVLSNMYADCRPRGELYTNYPVADILAAGITGGNLCGNGRQRAKPGELVLFEIPKTFVRKFPEPPVTNLPHSDENPNQPPPQ